MQSYSNIGMIGKSYENSLLVSVWNVQGWFHLYWDENAYENVLGFWSKMCGVIPMLGC